jgi:class 3 adenylate cyclase
MSTEPQFRFCTSADGVRIAYMTYGSGPPLLYVRVFWASMGDQLTHSAARHYFDALATGMTLVTFDRRGTGESARDADDISPEAEARDIEAVADATGLGAFSVLTDVDGLAAAARYSADQGTRADRLAVWASGFAPTDISAAWVGLMRVDWSAARRLWAGGVFPQGPVAFQRDFSQRTKAAVSGEMAARRFETYSRIDFAALIPAVTIPTLVLGREEPASARQRAMRFARLFPAAEVRFVPGDDVTPLTVHEPIVEAIEQFVGLRRQVVDEPRAGAAVILFTDIVSSTELTERMGDARFRDASRSLDAGLRAAIRDAGGAAIDGKLLGDGVLATFPSAAQAIDGARRCLALSAASELGLHIGLHAGDVIREDNNVYGGAVNIASRICGLSAPGEILVSDVVRGMARSSAGVEFEDRGEQEMKGVGEPVRVYAVRAQA